MTEHLPNDSDDDADLDVDDDGEATTPTSTVDNNDDTPNDTNGSDNEAIEAPPIVVKRNPWQKPNHPNDDDNDTNDTNTTPTTSNYNHLSLIMAEQEDERRQLEERIKNVEESSKRQQQRRQVSFAEDREEEEMIRLAIEASLAVDVNVNVDSNDSSSRVLSPTSTFDGSIVGQPPVSTAASASVPTSVRFGFGTVVGNDLEGDNIEDDDDDRMDEEMKLAIELSLQESRTTRATTPTTTSAVAAFHSFIYDNDDNDKKMSSSLACDNIVIEREDFLNAISLYPYDNDVNDMKPSYKNYKQDDSIEENDDNDDDKKMASLPPLTPYDEDHEEMKMKPSPPTLSNPTLKSTSASTSISSKLPPPTTNATATITPQNQQNHELVRNKTEEEILNENEDEMIARALHEADDLEMAKSMKLAMQLQSEEDGMREDERRRMVKCDNRGNVRTVGRDEFEARKLQPSGLRRGGEGEGSERSQRQLWGGNDYEEHHTQFHPTWSNAVNDEEDMEVGYRINPSTPSKTPWSKVSKNIIVGPNREVRTKHDVELKHRSNAERLLGANYSQTALGAGGGGTGGGNDFHYSDNNDNNNDNINNDAHSGEVVASKSNLLVSDAAYNSFHRSLKNSRGKRRSTVKGVAAHGHGRAENMNVQKTRGGAIDGHVRELISKAINIGLIQRCNGVVKEGKEAIVYHADGGNGLPITDDDEKDGTTTTSWEPRFKQNPTSDGFDVAIKVFKRIQEFRGRGEYIDGDSRYSRQSFHKLDQRQQIEVWTEKEYRNLVRANNAGVPVPTPLSCKKNVLFMRFLGEDGWPALQLREIGGGGGGGSGLVRKGSGKWTELYCQVLVAIKRLYWCAHLVHGDISEYNILVCPMSLVENAFEGGGRRRRRGGGALGLEKDSLSIIGEEKETKEEKDGLQAVLIDFGQAVERRHPSAHTYLCRDLRLIREFFVKQGISTLSIDESEQFIVREQSGDDSDGDDDDSDDDDDDDDDDNNDDDNDDESFRKNESNKLDEEINDDNDGEEEEVEEEKGVKDYTKRKCKISWDDTTHFEWLENKLRSAKIISSKT